MRNSTRLSILFLLLAGLLFAGCQKAQRGPAPLPQLKIGKAQFTQPTTTVDLMAGYIPEDQHKAGPEVLIQLDDAFASELQQNTKRSYTLVLTGTEGVDTATYKPGQSPALLYWTELGKRNQVDLLVVPQVLDFVPREGGEFGVTKPAHVVIDFFLIDVREGTLVARYRFDEEQIGLAYNLLDINQFFSRGGKWLTATELSREGMRKAIKEFGL